MAGESEKYFRIEAREILEQLSQGALDLEKGSSSPDAIAGLLRLAHTLKGAARVVKRREIGDLAHALEDALADVRDATTSTWRERIDRVLALVDGIAGHVGRLTSPAAAAPLARADASESAVAPARPSSDDLDTLLASVFGVQTRLAVLRPKLAQLERAGRLTTLVSDRLRASPGPAAPADRQAIASDALRSIADDLHRTLGALGRDLTVGLDQLEREIGDVREAADRLSLASAGALFTFLERAVRDAAAALGKQVSFDALGKDVRVDALVLHAIQGALLHIVRNAVAHGIESAAERTAAGKPGAGRVVLRVAQRGAVLSFACSDDGRGIDLDAVRKIAERRGLGGGRVLEAEDLVGLLLEGGISTADGVTDVSGRGIGLGAVREAIARLGGTVTVRTEAGAGTTVEIVVPLSISAMHALLVDVGGAIAAIPLDAVRGLLQVSEETVVAAEPHQTVLFGGQAIRLASLTQTMFPASTAARSDIGSAVVVHGRSGTVAFHADRVRGTAEIVMRPLPRLAVAAPIVAGAALDEVGNPRLVLDADSLVSAALRQETPPVQPGRDRLPLLVVDDSLTTRMLEQSILESAGYDVDLATSAEDGLAKARAARYALCLVDVEMPGMDGFTFIEQIRADPALRHIPAILVTSRDAPEDRQRGRDVGAQGYMVKSEFAQGVLLDQIRALLEN